MRLSSFQTDPTELMVLAVLKDETLYGYAITKRIGSQSGGEVKLGPGVLYPLLARMEKSGLIAAQWEEIKSERAEEEAPGRRRKWYRLTPKGRRRLEKRITAHRAYIAVMESFISPARVQEGSP